jgi:hypothetical protein
MSKDIKITEKEITDRPNDQELGAYIRKKLKEKKVTYTYKVDLKEIDNYFY